MEAVFEEEHGHGNPQEMNDIRSGGMWFVAQGNPFSLVENPC